MRTLASVFYIVAIVAFVAACVPERVTWSPDGQQAAVQAADGLRLATADGKLSDVLVKEIGWVHIWFPDSKRMLTSHKQEAVAWKDLAAVLTPEELAEVEQNAKRVHDELLKYDGAWDDFIKDMAGKLQTRQLGEAQWPVLLVYLRENKKDQVAEKLGAKWKEVQELKIPLSVLQVYDLADGKLAAGKVLYTGFRDINAARIAPNGKGIVFTETLGKRDNDDDTLRLTAILADGTGKPRRISDLVSWFPDISADSREVVYLRADGVKGDGSKSSLRLGSVCRAEIFKGDGGFVEADLAEQMLATVAYGPLARVRALADGRIAFNAPEVRLPASTNDSDRANVLWTVRPADGNDVARLTPAGEGTGAINADFFEVSPDSKHFVVANGEGAVVVVDATSGKVTPVQKDAVPHGQNQPSLRTTPVWRSNDQACFVAPVKDPAPGTPTTAVVLYTLSTSTTQVLSKDWPAAAVEDFLMSKPPAKPDN